MSLLTSALRALGFIDTPGKAPPPGARLDAAAKRLGEVSLYVGDDGLIYC